MTLFRTLVLGHIRLNRLRSLVTVLAVGLGVAISLAVELANATAVASFAKSVNLVANHVNLQVLGIGRGFDERALLRVQALEGVRTASPAIEDSLVAGARAGVPMSGEVLHVLGVDLLRPLPQDESQRVATPGAYDAPGAQSDPYELIAARGAIVSAARCGALRPARRQPVRGARRRPSGPAEDRGRRSGVGSRHRFERRVRRYRDGSGDLRQGRFARPHRSASSTRSASPRLPARSSASFRPAPAPSNPK